MKLKSDSELKRWKTAWAFYRCYDEDCIGRFYPQNKKKLSVEFGGIEKYVTRENLIWRRREKVLWQIT